MSGLHNYSRVSALCLQSVKGLKAKRTTADGRGTSLLRINNFLCLLGLHFACMCHEEFLTIYAKLSALHTLKRSLQMCGEY